MQTDKYAVVITTINHPTEAVKALARGITALDAELYIVGDKKSPRDFYQSDAIYLDLDDQLATGFQYASLAPTGHYARKNVGYLAAMKAGASIIIETDDDNLPLDAFWSDRKLLANARIVSNRDWVNVYRYFSKNNVWPRGLPLNWARTTPPNINEISILKCPIQQGLADGDPDVDAIYRLTGLLPIKFDNVDPIAIRDAWCPFNSQNTTFFREAFPLMYLPSHCSFRMTDIWRSFVAQIVLYRNGWGVLFHNSTVFQNRNEHDLMKDFAEEIPGYLQNDRIRRLLESIELPQGSENVGDAMLRCYQTLCNNAIFDPSELNLVEAWLHDLSDLGI